MAERAPPALGAALPNVQWRQLGLRALGIANLAHGFVLAGAFALYAALAYVRASGIIRPVFDDSFITLNFARNLAEFGKLTFDGVNWSTGATSPLHVAILAALIKLGADPIFSSIAVGVASHVLLALAVYALAWVVYGNRLAGLLAAAIIAFASYAALDAGNGLETSLFLFLVTASMTAVLVARRPGTKALAGLLIALAILTRPEGAFLLPAVVLYRWLDREKGAPLRPFVVDAALYAAAGVLALACLAGFSYAVNGTLAGTASVKLSFFRDFEWKLDEKLDMATTNVMQFAAPLIAPLVLAAAGARKKPVILFALFWVPIFVLYVWAFPGGLLHYFYRYQHPVLPFMAVLAGGGASYLLRHAFRRDAVAVVLVVAGLAVVAVPMAWQFDYWRLVYRDSSYEILADLEAMARELDEIVQPGEVLATHDIGAVGYFGDYEVLDLVGLVNPEVVPYHEERCIGAYIDMVQPDYLLMFPEWDYLFMHIYPGDQPEKYELLKVYKPIGRIRGMEYILYRITYP